MTRLGSLCSGYGGLDLAVAAHYGATVAWHAEIDKDCDRVLAARFLDESRPDGHVPNLGDLTQLDGMWGALEPVDVLCAGFPCQPFSVAGLKKGTDDERAIFPYIADCVAALRPRRVVLENVPGITIHGSGVVATLAALRYDCRWIVVPASAAGAPHKRARWFCVAHDADTDSEGLEGHRRQHELSLVAGSREGDAPVSGCGSAADADSAGWGEQRRAEPMGTQLETAERDRSRVDFGPYRGAVERWERILGRPVPHPTDERGNLSPWFVEWMMGLDAGWVCGDDVGLSRTAALKMLGNGVVWQQAALALTLLDPIPNHDQEAR